MSKSIRVVMLDGHRGFADKVRLLLAADERIRIVGSASSVEKALALLARYRPDVVLVDLDIKGVDSIQAIRKLRQMQPRTRVVAMSASEDSAAIRRAMDAGASGSIRKARAAAILPSVIGDAAAGKVVVPDGRTQRLDRSHRARSEREDLQWDPTTQITSRELEVLALLAQGKSTQEVADTLGISVLTVRGHVKRMLGRLGVHSRAEALSLALRRGLIQTD